MKAKENVDKKPATLRNTKDCYQLVKSENVNKDNNAFRISQHTSISKLAFQIIKKADQEKDQQVEVVGMGHTIIKVIKLVEFLKKSVHGLHIAYKIGSIPFEETFEPLYEGLKTVVSINNKPAMFAYFSFNEKLLKGMSGYQAQEKVNQEESKKLVEKAKTYTYSRINEIKQNKFNNRNQRTQEGENAEKVEKTERPARPQRTERPQKQKPQRSQSKTKEGEQEQKEKKPYQPRRNNNERKPKTVQAQQ